MVSKSKIKQSPKLPPEERRGQLLSSAHELFVKKGFSSATVEEIARQAGVTKGALYFHFKTKEDVLLALVRSFADMHEAHFEEHLVGKVTPALLMKIFLDVPCCKRKRKQADVVDIWVQAWRIPRIKRFIVSRYRRGLKRFTQQLDLTGCSSKVKPEEVAVMICALVDGLSTMCMMMPSTIKMENQLELIEVLFSSPGKRAGGCK